MLRPETLKEANDRVSNAIAELPIFRQYDLGGLLHSSSDGQKFETRIPTINARHSPKYFGLHKGIVSYTLVANHIPVNATIIGANEHESHYVFDLLFNNSTEIQPDVHSTDTHGANEVNFALLHVFGYRFAPRYRDLYDKVRTSLYGFKHPSQYANLVLKPIRKINTRLIIEEWENLQRIFVSLALKTTTQSIIVGKLSAYARKNKTRRALWEYDNIIRSLYLLDYIDSPPLRQNVQRALNRGENYHQLHRAVSYANFGKLRFRTEYEQHLWGECSRLLTNCIIAYNATILSHLLAHKERSGDASGAARLIRVSPVAWQHINLYGRYEFRKAPETIDLSVRSRNWTRSQSSPTWPSDRWNIPFRGDMQKTPGRDAGLPGVLERVADGRLVVLHRDVAAAQRGDSGLLGLLDDLLAVRRCSSGAASFLDRDVLDTHLLDVTDRFFERHPAEGVGGDLRPSSRGRGRRSGWGRRPGLAWRRTRRRGARGPRPRRQAARGRVGATQLEGPRGSSPDVELGRFEVRSGFAGPGGSSVVVFRDHRHPGRYAGAR